MFECLSLYRDNKKGGFVLNHDHPHVQALKDKHRKLDQEISAIQAAPSADALRVAELKKKKLALKEEIHLHS